MFRFFPICGGFYILVCSAQPALAYLDPGTGSIIIQSIIGGIAAVTTFGAVYWAKVKDFFKRKPYNRDEE
jgi:hypothetical protein